MRRWCWLPSTHHPRSTSSARRSRTTSPISTTSRAAPPAAATTTTFPSSPPEATAGNQRLNHALNRGGFCCVACPGGTLVASKMKKEGVPAAPLWVRGGRNGNSGWRLFWLAHEGLGGGAALSGRLVTRGQVAWAVGANRPPPAKSARAREEDGSAPEAGTCSRRVFRRRPYGYAGGRTGTALAASRARLGARGTAAGRRSALSGRWGADRHERKPALVVAGAAGASRPSWHGQVARWRLFRRGVFRRRPYGARGRNRTEVLLTPRRQPGGEGRVLRTRGSATRRAGAH